MSGLDFTKVEDTSLTKKSYSESLDDKFGEKKAVIKTPAKSADDNKRIIKKPMEGWSETENTEVTLIREYKDGEIFRTTSYLHPRIQLIEEGETQIYLLDGKFSLRAEEEKLEGKRLKGLYNLRLYDGDSLIFLRFYYKNGVYREEFTPDEDTKDVRHLNSKGEPSSPSGTNFRLPYQQKQFNIYSPVELHDVVMEVAAERKLSKSQLVNAALGGTLDRETALLLRERMNERGIPELLQGD